MGGGRRKLALPGTKAMGREGREGRRKRAEKGGGKREKGVGIQRKKKN